MTGDGKAVKGEISYKLALFLVFSRHLFVVTFFHPDTTFIVPGKTLLSSRRLKGGPASHRESLSYPVFIGDGYY